MVLFFVILFDGHDLQLIQCDWRVQVDYVVEKEKKKILACPICYNSLAALISQPHESA